MLVLESLLYTEEHEWVKIEDDKAYIGITDYAQKALGAIVFVELPEVDAEYLRGDIFGVVESVKAASDIFLPLSGTIVEVNDLIMDKPELLNKDAYGNWLICVQLSDIRELEDLLDAEAYKNLCNREA